MQIGKHKIKNKLVVAPMAGVTDRPFRILARSLGIPSIVALHHARQLIHESEWLIVDGNSERSATFARSSARPPGAGT